MDGVTGINGRNVIIRPPMRTGIRDAFCGREPPRVIFNHPDVRALRLPPRLFALQCTRQICCSHLLCIFINIYKNTQII
jgi:hypothetical protein